jgi:hypothetical protein
MSPARAVRTSLLSLLVAAAAIACGDSKSVAPDGGTNPLKDRVQLQSPDTARGGSVSAPPSLGDGYFRGVVRGYSQADLPDTIKSAKSLANVAVTAYAAELTDGEPKLGQAVASVTTSADGQFTLGILPGRLYAVTFVPAKGDPHESGWTLATVHPKSGDTPWTIMLRSR